MEIHTSDMSADCLHAVELRLMGKRVGSTQGAKFRGNVWHKARELCATGGQWHEFAAAQASLDAQQFVIAEAKDKNEPLTDSCRKQAETHAKEVCDLLPAYGRRVWSRWTKVIGQEVPLRCTIDVDGEPVEFASHLDVLGRIDGRLTIDDDKTQEEAPMRDYLTRNIQFAMYCYAVKHGTVLLDGEWVAMNEWPNINWIQIRNLKAYGRKTTVKEFDGSVNDWVDVTYEKGAERPIDKIIMPAFIDEAQEPEILREFTTRVRMMRAGLWPKNPSEMGCFLCDSRRFCRSYEGTNE